MKKFPWFSPFYNPYLSYQRLRLKGHNIRTGQKFKCVFLNCWKKTRPLKHFKFAAMLHFFYFLKSHNQIKLIYVITLDQCKIVLSSLPFLLRFKNSWNNQGGGGFGGKKIIVENLNIHWKKNKNFEFWEHRSEKKKRNFRKKCISKKLLVFSICFIVA